MTSDRKRNSASSARNLAAVISSEPAVYAAKGGPPDENTGLREHHLNGILPERPEMRAAEACLFRN